MEVTDSMATAGQGQGSRDQQTCHRISGGHCRGTAATQPKLKRKPIYFFIDLLALAKFKFKWWPSKFQVGDGEGAQRGVGSKVTPWMPSLSLRLALPS